MKSARIAAVVIAVLFGGVLRADVTVRYKNELKVGAGAPPAVAQQTAGVMKSTMPTETVIQIKGTKGYTSNGKIISLTDFEKQVITVVDPEHKQFATVYMKDYADQVLSVLPAAAAPPSDAAQKLLNSMKTTFTSEKTGKTDTILGIQAEETLLTLTVFMPLPSAASSTAPARAPQPAELMKMDLHIWTALPSEVERIPALHEFSSVYGDGSAASVLNPDALLGKAFGAMPGMGKGFTDMLDELSQKKAIMLKTDIEMFMPFMAQMLQSSPAGANQAASFDPKAPVFEVNMDVQQISDASIDDSVFEVPEDCHLTSLPDFFRAVLPTAPQPAAASAQQSSQ